MKISLNWLKDYVEIKLKPQALAEKLTMAGLEVTALEEKQGDWSLEMEITSNRPDLLSLIGIAREVAAITGKKVKLDTRYSMLDTRKNENRGSSIPPKARLAEGGKDQRFGIKIEDKKGCAIYSARLIKDVKVSHSPTWLKQKLESVGIRSVNNIVDITNFCLMEWGQPLHAFDFDKLAGGKIIVRRAKDGEKIITIDKEERILNPEILVIADSKKPIALAGVMGGLDTEVTSETKNILLESAYFNPILIRRCSRSLGISSDSSYRFERGVDRENVLLASNRAVNLIQDLAAGYFTASISQKTKLPREKSKKIKLFFNAAENLLGIKISPKEIKQILLKLQFKVKTKQNFFYVEAPSFRQDLKEEVDLIEEIARIYGYHNLPLTLPAIKISSLKIPPQRNLEDFARRFFVGAGFSEIISYSLISHNLLNQTNLKFPELTAIANPLSKEQEILSPSLIPGLLTALKNNLNHNITDLKLFEIGKNYLATKENSSLGIIMRGEKYQDWLRASKQKIGFFDLKGSLEAFLRKLGILNFQFLKEDLAVFSNASVLKIGGEKIAILGEVADSVLSNWDIKQKEIFLAEINLTKLGKFVQLEKRFAPIISFPSIKRDISLLVKEEVASESIFEIAQEKGGFLLKDLRLADLYRGGQILKGFKGLTLSLEYQAKDRTLTDSEVNLAHEKICQGLQEQLQAKIR